MTSVLIKSKVLQEIDLIPEDSLTDLYNFIHYFRLGLERSQVTRSQPIMAFAGCWKDMPEDVFADLMAEIQERRRQAFRGRRTE
jgi:hypothetical protein